MKHRIKKVAAFVLFVFVMASILAFSAHADEFKILSAKSKVVTGVDKTYGCLIDLSSKLKGMKDGKVTVSNKKVIKDAQFTVMDMSEYSGQIYLYLTFKPVKKGTSKITVSGTVGGKNKSFSTTVKVVKYQNPFKALKLGSKNYKSKFKKYTNTVVVTTTEKTPKLTVKPAAGWKLKSIKYSSYTTASESKKIKSGKTVSLYADGTWIECKLVNSRTKVTETLYLLVNPS